MPVKILIHLRSSAFICGLIFLSSLAHAQTYPAKPIRFILSYPPGGATDTLGRIVAKSLSDAWGVNVIADNRPGASGNIGTALCAKSPPDGYTMCMVAPAQAIASRLSANAGYDSLKDFSHVTLVATVPMLLLVHPSLPAKNLAELIALARRRPGALNYASSGGGASPHLAMELLKQQAGVDIALITYKGAGAQLVDHLAGRVEIAFAPAVGVMPFVKEGRLRAIAVSTKERFPPRSASAPRSDEFTETRCGPVEVAPARKNARAVAARRATEDRATRRRRRSRNTRTTRLPPR